MTPKIHVQQGSLISQKIGSARFFRNSEALWKHLRDHLLTRPECSYWRSINTRLLDLIPGGKDARETLVLELKKQTDSGLLRAHPLSKGYASECQKTLAQAERLGWAREAEGNRYLAFGPSAVLILIQDGFLATAYFPCKWDGVTPQQDAILPREPAEKKNTAQLSVQYAISRTFIERLDPEEILYHFFLNRVMDARDKIPFASTENATSLRVMKPVFDAAWDMSQDEWLAAYSTPV